MDNPIRQPGSEEAQRLNILLASLQIFDSVLHIGWLVLFG